MRDFIETISNFSGWQSLAAVLLFLFFSLPIAGLSWLCGVLGIQPPALVIYGLEVVCLIMTLRVVARR